MNSLTSVIFSTCTIMSFISIVSPSYISKKEGLRVESGLLNKNLIFIFNFLSETLEEGGKERGKESNPGITEEKYYFEEESKILAEIIRKGEHKGTYAEDRQLVPFSQLPANTIEEIFERSMLELPNDIDMAREVIIEDIAKTNMLGYTIVAAYLFGATLDTIGDFFLIERFLSGVKLDLGWWLHIGRLWFLAAGFSGPNLFPSTFNGGDPNLQCSSENFFNMLRESDLSTDIRSVTSKTEGEVIILSEKLRLDFNSRLNCILDLKDKYSVAELVHGKFESLLDLITLHHDLTAPEEQLIDLDVVDSELVRIWDSMSILVQEVHRDVTADRARRARIFVFIGMINLFGVICGVLLQLYSADYVNIPGIPGGSPFIDAVNSKLNTFLINGQFTNDFVLGEGLSALSDAFGWGYSYYMTYFLFVEEADPGCGLADMEGVFSRYEQLRSFDLLMSSGQVRPKFAKYLVKSWKRQLDVALHCLLKTREGIRLGNTIEMFINLANFRIDMS